MTIIEVEVRTDSGDTVAEVRSEVVSDSGIGMALTRAVAGLCVAMGEPVHSDEVQRAEADERALTDLLLKMHGFTGRKGAAGVQLALGELSRRVSDAENRALPLSDRVSRHLNSARQAFHAASGINKLWASHDPEAVMILLNAVSALGGLLMALQPEVEVSADATPVDASEGELS
jgi:hypothetical protein